VPYVPQNSTIRIVPGKPFHDILKLPLRIIDRNQYSVG